MTKIKYSYGIGCDNIFTLEKYETIKEKTEKHFFIEVVNLATNTKISLNRNSIVSIEKIEIIEKNNRYYWGYTKGNIKTYDSTCCINKD